MGKIAVELQQALAHKAATGVPGRIAARVLERGEGWDVADVICTLGPADRPFAERHGDVSIALVVAGSFEYRSTRGAALLTPGSFMLGNAGESFQCRHDHAPGDRCVGFRYAPAYFERLAADAGTSSGERPFRVSQLPPLAETAALLARAARAVAAPSSGSWEELALQVAAAALRLSHRLPRSGSAAPAHALQRVTRAVRAIESDPGARWRLSDLAADAGLSPYHYLRTFREVTGTTPHQFILRARLRDAAARLVRREGRVIDVALDLGFGDVSTFNRAFRAEFGAAPIDYHRAGTPADTCCVLPVERRPC